jgi:undecaprenyl-diphosphatase
MIKRTMRRPRPSHPAINVVAANIGGSSFPSGHVINYIGVYGFFLFLVHTYVKTVWIRKPIEVVLGSMIGLVGLSRIYLGHHWLTDVLASYLLGFSYLIGLTSVYRRLKRRRAHR